MKTTVYLSFLIVSLCLGANNVLAAQNPFEIYQKNLNENNYLTPLVELERREAEFMKSPQWSGLIPDLLAYLNSYVGRYDVARAYYDRNFEKQIKPQPDLTSSPLDDYEMRDAFQSIVSIAEKQQVVMINEEHDGSLHRAFTARLLPHLYKAGFRYLAAETLGEDEALQKRGYPVQKTGFYSVDPVFGDMLRTALKLGFKPVQYEHRPMERCTPTAEKPNFCQDERERGQAQNLYENIFKNDPNAKVLVHVGRGHNQKSKQSDWAFMAWHFREISGINPLSINQMMSERSAPRFERPEYRYITSNRKFTAPVVFQSKTGEWHKGNGFDLIVFHPRSHYENGRPIWLKMDGRRRAEKINLKKLKLKARNQTFAETNPVLIQAFVEGESADAIPIDQFILHPNQNIPPLMLPKGNFNIRAMDEKGKIAGQYNLTVK